MNLNERKQRWLDLYEGKKRTVVIIDHADYGIRPFPVPGKMDAFFDWNIRRYLVMMEHAEWLDDDTIPYVTAGMGTDIFAGAFGCPVYYPDDSNPYARPCVFNVNDLAKLKQPKLENSSLMKVLEFGHKLHITAPEAMIQLPDIQSPLDIAALIWEKADFFMTMLDEPQAIKDLLEMVYILETEFLDLWFKTFGREFIAHYPHYYMPFGITLSEDEIGSINTEQFKEFVLPMINKLSLHFGGKIGIHCCANARHQWELIKTIPGLILFNMGQQHDANNMTRMISELYRNGPVIWARSPEQNECYDIHSLAVLQGHAESKEQALMELKHLREFSTRFKPG